MEFCLLAANWPRPGCRGPLEREPVDGSAVSVSLVTLPFKQNLSLLLFCNVQVPIEEADDQKSCYLDLGPCD